MGRIAIVDSDPQERVSLAAALRGAGHEALEWAGARTALDELVVRAPDLLLIALSDASGVDMVARLRSCHARPFPVLLVSADPADARRASVVGASQHLMRPVAVETIAQAAERLLRLEPLEHDLPCSEDGLVFGRYTLKSILGKGSFGAVYEGFDTRRGGPVALKVLSPSVEDLDDLARFVREARVLSRVEDAHVVPMLDAGVMEGRAFCAMRLVKGPTLDAHLRARGPLGEDETVAMLTGLLRALDALARKQLVHRDVTPRNIILEGGKTARPVLIDFGLAKRAHDQGLTAPDVLLGTAGYIAPEVVCGSEADPRSDMFAAGIVALHALLGRHPVEGLRHLALIQAMADVPVPMPAHLSSGLRQLLEHLTALDPEMRPPSPAVALTMLSRLSRLGPDTAPLPRPVPVREDGARTRLTPRPGRTDG